MFKTLYEAFTSWSVPSASLKELVSADVVVTHEFGDQKRINTTLIEMAKIAILLRDDYQKPWIAQYPGNLTTATPPLGVIKMHLLKHGAYLDTEEVNRQVAVVCRAHGWKTVILITHPHHAWRAGKNLEHHGLNVVFPDLESVKYDSHTSRLVLTSPLFFIPREIIARLVYFCKSYLS
jgi:hypothetical protein